MTDSNISADSEEAYTTLRRLIPQLAEELDTLRASLREHNVWLQRYGSSAEAPHTAFSSASPYNPANNDTRPETATTIETTSSSGSSSKTAPNYSASATSNDAAPQNESSSEALPPRYASAALGTANVESPASGTSPAPPPPGYVSSASDEAGSRDSSSHPPAYPAGSSSHVLPMSPSQADGDILPSYGNTSPPPPAFIAPPPSREEMAQRRDQTAEWLREGEDVLREYSARFAQLGTELQRPFEDVLGTWESSHPDNALPDYERVEERDELMVGGVGEVPPPYIGAAAEGRGIASSSEADTVHSGYGDERDLINEVRRQQATEDQRRALRSEMDAAGNNAAVIDSAAVS